MQFKDIFAGEGVRGGKVQGDASVDGVVVGTAEQCVGGVARCGSLPNSALAMALVAGPEMRTIPMPPRPGGVAMAAMVSGVVIMVS